MSSCSLARSPGGGEFFANLVNVMSHRRLNSLSPQARTDRYRPVEPRPSFFRGRPTCSTVSSECQLFLPKIGHAPSSQRAFAGAAYQPICLPHCHQQGFRGCHENERMAISSAVNWADKSAAAARPVRAWRPAPRRCVPRVRRNPDRRCKQGFPHVAAARRGDG